MSSAQVTLSLERRFQRAVESTLTGIASQYTRRKIGDTTKRPPKGVAG
jgi:hypothetical protein